MANSLWKEIESRQNQPDQIQHARADFPQTRWTMVASAQTTTDESRRQKAMAELCQAYWYPLYAFLRRSGQSSADAEDLTQGFFAHLLDGERLMLLSDEKGRLRAYLLGALKNFVAADMAKNKAQKRGGQLDHFSLDFAHADERYGLEPGHHQDPEKLYELGVGGDFDGSGDGAIEERV